MSLTGESLSSSEFRGRYTSIDEANRHSFYLTNPDRPFDVFTSVHSVGDSREAPEKKVGRYLLAGNMSTLNELGPQALSPEERILDAYNNMNRYLDNLGINPADVRLLKPERNYSLPLTVVNVDEQIIDPQAVEPTTLDKRGDFLYTYNPDVVLGVRPADCPIVVASAETPNGRIYTMTHFAWRGAAQPQTGVKQMAKEWDNLGVDRSTLEAYVTPGGHAENYPYVAYPEDPHIQYPGTEKLFTNVEEHEDGFSFGIDTPYFVYSSLLELGLDQKQIFVDTSDTSAPESGYSSHNRSSRLKQDNTRDLIIIRFK